MNALLTIAAIVAIAAATWLTDRTLDPTEYAKFTPRGPK